MPVVKRLTRMPVCIDPSHSVGRRALAPDGLLDIFHVDRRRGSSPAPTWCWSTSTRSPTEALCDGPQALTLDELPHFIEDVAIARHAYGAGRLLRRHAQRTAS